VHTGSIPGFIALDWVLRVRQGAAPQMPREIEATAELPGGAPVPTPTSTPFESGAVEPPREPPPKSTFWARVERLPGTVRRGLEHPHVERARSVLLPVALLFGVCFFGYIVNQRYALKDWLFFSYAKSWLLVMYWLAGAMSGGHAIVRRLARHWPLSEQLVLSLATGVYLYYVLMFFGGIFGLYRFGAFALLLPLALVVAGGRALFSLCRRALRHYRAVRRRLPRRFSLLGIAITAFGTMYLGLLYLYILTPDNASFDALYYHLGIPQQNRALGGIYRTPEGWIVDGLPSLASVNYTWAFVFPTNDLFDRMMACAHMEYVLFAATLFSMPVLVRRLVPGSRSWGAWVAMFLFPAVLVYDAALHSANDHIAAFWGMPIWLALRRAWPRLEPRAMALFAVAASGALMTKYQAFGLVLAPALALCARGAWLGWRKTGAPWWQGLGTALGVALVITAPHWLKNWIWYGDPLFPALYKHLTLRPFHPHAAEALQQTTKLLQRPHGSFGEQLGQIWRGAIEFPFRTRERPDFHRDWPIFGPLFHLSIFWLPFLRGTRRTWPLFFATFAGLFFWYYFNHWERYLQPMVPWMAAVTAATIILIWRRGWVTKAALTAMVALEVVWGADTIFFPNIMLRDSPIRTSIELITSGFRGDLARRENFVRPFKDIGEALPKGARILLHEYCPRIGLDAPVINDFPGFQTRISYQDLSSARAVYDIYRDLGVTHLVHQDAYASWLDNLAGDLRFWEFASNWAQKQKHYGPFILAEMPEKPPDQALSNLVAYLSCDPTYTRGLHPIAALEVRPGDAGPINAIVPLPKDNKAILALVKQAGFLVTGSTCKKLKWPQSIYADFKRVAKRGAEDLWIRRLDAPGLHDLEREHGVAPPP
jgi:hypothetical protein